MTEFERILNDYFEFMTDGWVKVNQPLWLTEAEVEYFSQGLLKHNIKKVVFTVQQKDLFDILGSLQKNGWKLGQMVEVSRVCGLKEYGLEVFYEDRNVGSAENG